jgi:hypothetical protein
MEITKLLTGWALFRQSPHQQQAGDAVDIGIVVKQSAEQTSDSAKEASDAR